MAALAINLLALLIVLGLCWVSMMWLSGRFHGVRHTDDLVGTDSFRASKEPLLASTEAPCTACEGVGAHNTHGRLAPCPECYGTGILSS